MLNDLYIQIREWYYTTNQQLPCFVLWGYLKIINTFSKHTVIESFDMPNGSGVTDQNNILTVWPIKIALTLGQESAQNMLISS